MQLRKINLIIQIDCFYFFIIKNYISDFGIMFAYL